MNCYKILGVNKNASQSDIKKAYRNLVKQHHPDTGGSEERFKEISVAYETLSDPQKREEHDLKSSFNGGGFDQFYNQFGGDFSSMFNNAFNQNARGLDVRVRINITVEDVYHGTSRYINTGSNQFNIKIPKGVLDGAQLRVSGKGQPHPANSSAQPGDAIIIISILPDPDLIVTGSDIWVDAPIPFFDMILGCSYNVNTKVGKFKINVPKNSYEGKVLRISGKGMPIYNTNSHGNLMVKLRSAPIELDDKQIEYIKKIKELSNA